jgi:2-oxoglutarate dehydrogenase E1 component
MPKRYAVAASPTKRWGNHIDRGFIEREMDLLNIFHGPNAGYIQELYERYLDDPQSVDAATRAIFERWKPAPTNGKGAEIRQAAPPPLPVNAEKITAAVNFSHAIRTFGHLAAQLDPLGNPPPGDPWLTLEYYGLTEADLMALPISLVGGPASEGAANAFEAIQRIQAIYTSRIGYDYGHIHNPGERQWLRYTAECGIFRDPQTPLDRIGLFHRLTQVEAFELFLHRIFPGKTRFSIEGLDILVPMLDELIFCAAEADIDALMIGMAHRGRLNVLAHNLGKPYEQIIAEFKDPVGNFPSREQLGWTGDVKYHKGAQRAVQDSAMIEMLVYMSPNPSHLEHVDPVVAGMARAAGTRADQPGKPEFEPSATLPVMIHGDASFPGQGVVAETLNFSRLEGYSVGGTIHIIANNQLGFTTTPQAGRSTLYASDLGKGFEIPVIHVNADDPQSCIEAIRTAYYYRERFHKDFLIDLIGYRRYGHNEGDEPSFTQPVMYAKIQEHPSLRKILAAQLEREGMLEKGQADKLLQERMDELQKGLASLEAKEEDLEPPLEPPPPGAASQVDTRVPLKHLAEINQALLVVPDGFHLLSKVGRVMKRRREIFDNPDEQSIDWAAAEELALATILADGTPIRFTGEDSERGTFSHRHAVFHDEKNGDRYIPLQSFPQAKASFEILNSPLSENAAIGFEFGFDIIARNHLVIWEAQYGDFINTAQAMIDEFLVSARAKWEQTPCMVLLLPHGYEGQGPDHSSGRPERFLEQASNFNLRLANCTTAAQYFHLLRRQAALLNTDPLPLIILTPKSLLRHPLVSSTPRELAEGRWHPVLDDPNPSIQPADVRRIILCSGKIYVDMVSEDRRNDREDIAILRLEQIYPFPADILEELIERYPNSREIVWVQEEPENMGAWAFVAPHLLKLTGGRLPVHFIARARRASPAEGSFARHVAHQKKIIEKAFEEKLEELPVPAPPPAAG